MAADGGIIPYGQRRNRPPIDRIMLADRQLGAEATRVLRDHGIALGGSQLARMFVGFLDLIEIRQRSRPPFSPPAPAYRGVWAGDRHILCLP